ncbi:hypothetical protein [Prescottella agglutinans]|uniref:Uncharacterized protein n=1 Tax=Prescottella agglutinans TaxID=1644129 RepID=A0ABT6MEN5_9NOCA|nr:hypothetical protein [Prescottella agglutinans]MDH6282782.1 hypothetical protein [Prescottella agglutinans]
MEDQEQDGREVLTEINFRAGIPDGHPLANPDAPEPVQSVMQPELPPRTIGTGTLPPRPADGHEPEALATLRANITEALAAKRQADNDPERAFFREGLRILRIPESNGRPAVAIPIAGQADRLADALWDQGYRRHPELEIKRFVTDVKLAEHDEGSWVDRNPDGTWPHLNPGDLFDPADVTVVPTANGWQAIHTPTGTTETAGTKLAAWKKLTARLEGGEG